MKEKIGIIIFPVFCLLFSLAILRTDPAFTYLLLENKEAAEPTKQLLQNFANKHAVYNDKPLKTHKGPVVVDLPDGAKIR